MGEHRRKTVVQQDAVEIKTINDPELRAAVAAFNKAFAGRSFSQRHTDLGKMINCPQCGRRHRELDPVAQLSAGHGEQSAQFQDLPSIHVMMKKRRILPHANKKLLQLHERAREIFTRDISPYFHEEGDRLPKRARRQALIQLTRERQARARAHQRQQDVSRRINRGSLTVGTQSHSENPVERHERMQRVDAKLKARKQHAVSQSI